MKEIEGIEQEIYYDKKIKKLNIELADDKGRPLILFQDWTKKSKCKTLITLHIKEAIELKSIIDKLVVGYLEDKIENKS